SHGSLSEIRLQWPNWKQSGWILEPIEPPGRVDQIATDGATPDLIRIRLVEPARKPFELRLRARRPVAREPAPAGSITLPAPEASSHSPLVLGISHADNVEVDFKPSGAAMLRPLPAQISLKIADRKSTRLNSSHRT